MKVLFFIVDRVLCCFIAVTKETEIDYEGKLFQYSEEEWRQWDGLIKKSDMKRLEGNYDLTQSLDEAVAVSHFNLQLTTSQKKMLELCRLMMFENKDVTIMQVRQTGMKKILSMYASLPEMLRDYTSLLNKDKDTLSDLMPQKSHKDVTVHK